MDEYADELHSPVIFYSFRATKKSEEFNQNHRNN